MNNPIKSTEDAIFKRMFDRPLKMPILYLVANHKMQTEIMKELDISHGSIINIMNDLEAEGLITKTKKGRISYINYTAYGWKIFFALKMIHETCIQFVAGKFEPYQPSEGQTSIKMTAGSE